jgi:DNA-binding transcriptional LysR family regulator
MAGAGHGGHAATDRAMRALEGALGVQPAARSGKGMRQTRAGAALLPMRRRRAADVVQAEALARETAAAVSGVAAQAGPG